MDPTTIAAVVASMATLAAEVSKGVAGEAGKDAWKKIKRLIGGDPTESVLQTQAVMTETLQSNPDMLQELLILLESSKNSTVQQLVGSINAEKVIVAGSISGNIQI